MKGKLITFAVVAAVLLFIFGSIVSANNRAVALEQRVASAEANVEVLEKRRVDLVTNLVDAVMDYKIYEGETIKDIATVRASAAKGNVDNAKVAVEAVAEAYPDLKASENYQQLMTELSLTENQIAQARQSYNETIRTYNVYVQKFPQSILLRVIGREPIQADYTRYDAPETAPQNLFGGE